MAEEPPRMAHEPQTVRERMLLLAALLRATAAALSDLVASQEAPAEGECLHLGATKVQTMGPGGPRLLCPNCGLVESTV